MPETGGTIQFTADRGDARLRLDQVLVRRIRDVSRLSRTVAQQWIASGAVTVDGVEARRPSVRVREGTSLEVKLPSTATLKLHPSAEDAPLDVLYEDEVLLVVNKPAGVVVHPSYKQTTGTLLNAVLGRVRDRAATRPGILTRLDRDTSGLVVIALTAPVHAAMQRDVAAGRVRKEYLAVVRGTPRPRSGRITLPLGRDPNDRRRIVTSPNGMPSETLYEVTSQLPTPQSHGRVSAARRELGVGTCSLLRCELVTGRTHQIRVHLASCGWPIVGDAAYGEPSVTIPRQALHAWRISLPHPVSRDRLTIEAPVPADMRALIAE
jgi:23S rRNA pseudouridine1911/1915/1917 synthase